MAGEIAIPLLPCRDIDEIAAFYTMLGFTQIYRQIRPNPYISFQREDLRLGFFGMPEFKPEDSYGTCLVVVPDPGELFEAFAAGMRQAHGKLLVSGIPRITRPRKRKNADNHSGFSVIDPGGNWIRIMAAKPAPEAKEEPSGKLTKSLNSAVVMGDSKGDHVRAAQILDGALERDQNSATTGELLRALTYRTELALRADDPAAARDALTRARALTLSQTQRDELADSLAVLEDSENGLRGL
ncbi:VOC family protein [Nonomuraea sp. NPDC048826]|uniref:VOC family protein n=1 Tax=Nonomuraea sp. NPDC048826 TaxID=3364347 RepID=UPI003713D780